jgi:hypothetical protein
VLDLRHPQQLLLLVPVRPVLQERMQQHQMRELQQVQLRDLVLR